MADCVDEDEFTDHVSPHVPLRPDVCILDSPNELANIRDNVESLVTPFHPHTANAVARIVEAISWSEPSPDQIALAILEAGVEGFDAEKAAFVGKILVRNWAAVKCQPTLKRPRDEDGTQSQAKQQEYLPPSLLHSTPLLDVDGTLMPQPGPTLTPLPHPRRKEIRAPPPAPAPPPPIPDDTCICLKGLPAELLQPQKLYAACQRFGTLCSLASSHAESKALIRYQSSSSAHELMKQFYGRYTVGWAATHEVVLLNSPKTAVYTKEGVHALETVLKRHEEDLQRVQKRRLLTLEILAAAREVGDATRDESATLEKIKELKREEKEVLLRILSVQESIDAARKTMNVLMSTNNTWTRQ